ncbi:MAG: hypothetical protein H0X73_08510 [Chthoniobacterales bacterium]|nr:hypothetical protein [Chthoniobacterales bacterium]
MKTRTLTYPALHLHLQYHLYPLWTTAVMQMQILLITGKWTRSKIGSNVHLPRT